ncbi:pimeloyl-CoA dehydrogenase small subunit [Pseudohalioglobus sediminis]|uniref:Pimeloyl-CoA dehydrogenase small subunit n=1 Tax=Pseudohalioglobus sediminis TaxID=2606449 RepID=A0A5B0X3P4_9GAMM|nr:acyl-CoA dehydrogenase [Pseudohalioglobus sediminis]KAA1193228.1 pimeloyl-CoA dehydrogenase small subunit [Pseudohalioglobus sediminis]
MNFNLSEEQTMIQDSIARFVQDNYDYDQRNKVVALEHGFSAEHWQQFAELGWLSIPFAEEYGGFGGGPVDTMVIMQELGRGLVAEPFLPTVLLFGGLLQAGGSEEVKHELIPQIIAGQLQGAFAFLERQSRYALTDIKTRARQDGVSWVLNGEKTVVLNGGAAEKLVVLARSSGEQADKNGLSLFLVDSSAAGVTATSYKMTDGRDAANVKLDNVTAEALIGGPGEGYALMGPVIERATLAVAADALGAMESLNAQTLEYLKTRKQFGAHIGSFQALQHRMVDMFAACENTRSLLYRAVCALDARDEDARRSLLALKVMVGRSGRKIGGEGIQMHGGMGMTEELSVGAYVKRLMIANTLFGDADYQQQRFSALVNAPVKAAAAVEAA